ncbi:wall-associated receptor kinase galacturonan-binding protein [Medicago truncatula]|uniref:non-specific serine/threonine protein kinase n=1 Tax=Medicago truncatula TaxID=3880 RepID=A0A072UC20_MEDTR|nr:wall-associated receptor kinase galacturonan-binding protein [Medicago truncatula]
MSKPLQTLFTLSIILITSCYADISNTSTLCPPSFCGNISIQYPFWIKSHTINPSDQLCGYPDFGLECSQDKAIITLPSDTYYVTNIDYDTYSITLVDIDILDQKCPRARKNVTLSNLPLSFSSLDLNLSFYFNCSSYPLSLDPIGCFELSNDEKLKSYVILASDEGEIGYDNWKCEEHVNVIVKSDELNDVVGGLINGFGSAMKKGFVLNWRKAEDCAQCEISGGYCGYNQSTKKSTCICGNGSVVAKSCKKGHGHLSGVVTWALGSVTSV